MNTTIAVHDFYTFLLVFARIGGLMSAAPLFSNRAIPKQVKAGFMLVFSLALTPLVAPHTGPVPDSLFLLVFGVLKDGLFGLAVGFVARVMFAAVEMAGYFTDTQMGFGFINLINPFSEQQASLMSTFQYQLAITIYLLANGHLILLGSLANSFQAIPPGAVVLQGSLAQVIAPLMKSMFILGLQMALPAIAVLLLIDVSFGLIARMVPQMNIFIVGMPAKVIVGLMIVAMVLPVISLIVGNIISGTSIGMNALVTATK